MLDDPLPDALAPADPWQHLRALTPARIALGRAGTSLTTRAHLEFQLAHARARDAVHDALDLPSIARSLGDAGFDTLIVHSAAPDRVRYLQRPDLGRRLTTASRAALAEAPGTVRDADLIIVVADGLSARAAAHAAPLASALVPSLVQEGVRVGPIVVAGQARVALGDEIGAGLGARSVLVLIGERPGLSAPDSLGAYFTWDPRPGRTDAERNCVSNIRPGGLAFDAAAGRLRFLVLAARRRRLSGVGLKDDTSLPVA